MNRKQSRKSSTALRHRSTRGAAELSEFALVLYILFFVILVPIVDLGGLLIAAGTQYLATNDFAAKAASQPDYINCLNAMFAESQKFEAMSIAKFMNMTPQGGYVGSGNDMYVLATNVSSGTTATSTANNSISPPIDTSANIYELSVKSNYSFKPLLNLSGVPLLGQVPGLGQPVTFTFVANRPIEHPGGLVANGTNANPGAVPVLPRNQAPAPLVSAGNAAQWRIPNIYQQIAAAGQTVISTNVVVVQGNNNSWTPANVNVNPSEKVWIDTQAVGQWNVGGSYGMTDANGLNTAENWALAPNLTYGALIAQIGTGAPFLLGDNQTNLAVTGSGPLTMINNDQYGAFTDNTGAQIVRIIVTQ